ncbi:hybrid sensor histidine kinase/response regulator [Pyxidicoccus sp. MSG2]|uniref:hybrid sensor histidine kinase/response regulator n=1 Tax=Pyxidicoccus sp. MSG2 TaxID=2996790 RepID=UPI00226EDC5B|nr:ATP-binding protein [Pyxidicoccus sp. MSG2]MCY1023393.1 ATP-binding protein [Pyxidicoccus sp. MSG2]
MTLAALISIVSTCLGLVVAALGFGFSSAPGWRDQRLPAWSALMLSGYSATNSVGSMSGTSDALVVLCSRGSMIFATLFCACWVAHGALSMEGRYKVLDRVLLVLLGLVALLTPWPGIVYTSEVVFFEEPWLKLIYRTLKPTLLGNAALVFLCVCLLVPLVRFGRAWWRGTADVGPVFLGLALNLPAAVNDSLVVAGVITTPFLTEVSLMTLVALLGVQMTRRFVANAKSLAELRVALEEKVSQRSTELTRMQADLMRHEKLAAIGQLAAGVAHEINNPSAAVAANLRYLREELAGGRLPEDSGVCIEESLASVQQISRIVRQLLDAGRAAAAPVPTGSHEVASAADAALATVRAANTRPITFSMKVPRGLYTVGSQDLLEQVLVNLMSNAIQAISPDRMDGEVRVEALRDGATVRIRVSDNGVGMSQNVQQRLFEPFFTTKGPGMGTGLGLSVSLGLLRTIEGTIHVESTPGQGSTFTVELGCASPPLAPPAPVAVSEPRARPRLLLVDDERSVREALRRTLRGHFEVTLASSPSEALRHVEGPGGFDVVLCDMTMPEGGGPAFHRELCARDVSLARRTVFYTGGVTSTEARDFVARYPLPVLEKPLDLGAFLKLVNEVMPAGSS